MVLPLTPGSADFINKLLPYQSHFVDVDGHQMHYIDEGPRNAPVVLLLHGNPTWCFYYRRLIDKLRGEFRVIAPDFIGCGLSSRPKGVRFRARHRIDHLRVLLSTLHISKYSLVMHDWGGSIGTALAAEDPAAVTKIVYLNTTLTETESLPKIIRSAAHPYIGKFLTQYSMHFLKLTTTPGIGVFKKVSKEVRQGYYYPYRSSARRAAIWDFVQDIPFDSSHPSYAEMFGLAEKLPGLANVPVQIIWGMRDPCFHREMLDRVVEHFPQASILEIADASHLVLEDKPDLVCGTIFNFFRTGEQAGVSRDPSVVPRNPLLRGFHEVAKTHASKEAAIVPSFLDSIRYNHTSFKEMAILVTKYQRGLHQLGLAPGDKVLMLLPGGPEFLALTYAVMANGALPFFLDPGMGKKNLFACIQEIDPDAFIGSAKAQLLRLKRKKLFPRLKFHITASDWLYTGGPNLGFLKKFSSRPYSIINQAEEAFVAYTSGATGRAKGVIFTNSMLAEHLRIFSTVFGFEAGKKDLPLLHIFSLFNLALGVCSVYPPMNPSKPLDIEPDKIVKVINDLEVDYSFGSPTIWNKIAEYCFRTRLEIPSVSKIFMAGAPVPLSTLSRVRNLLPKGEAYTPYGATEALPVTLVSSADITGTDEQAAHSGETGTFVGKPVPGVEIKIVKDSGSRLEECRALEIGEVVVCGANVSREYFDLPEVTAQSKILDGQKFWHRMGDMGYVDPQGNLYFCGRRAHSFAYSGRMYYSVPVERIFNKHSKVRRSALIRTIPNGEAAVVIEPLPQYWPEGEAERRKFSQELLALAKEDLVSASIRKIYFHPSFPVDARHNAKIFRDKLGEWAKDADGYSLVA